MVQNFGYRANLEAASNAFGSAFSSATTAANSTHEPSAENSTLLQTCGISVTPPPVDASAMMRDATNPASIGDLGQVQQAAAATRSECMQIRGATEAAHQEARGCAIALAKEAAPAVGVSPGAIDATFKSTCSTTEVAGMVAEATGLGSAATVNMASTADAAAMLHGEGTQLNESEVAAVAAEVSARINGCAQSTNIMDTFVEQTPMDFSNASFNLYGCTGDDIVELLETNFEDLEEVCDLDAIIDQLDIVDDNHLACAAAQEMEVEALDPEMACECSHQSVEALIAQAPLIEAINFENPADADLTALALSREAELARAGMAAQFGREATFVPASSAA